MRSHYIFCGLLLLILISTASADQLIISPTVDGYAVRGAEDSAFTSLISGAGTGVDSTSTTFYGPRLTSTTSSDPNTFKYYGRGILSFNTSEIPDDAIISSVVLNMTKESSANGFGSFTTVITSGTLASNTSLANGDYSRNTTTELTNRIAYADIGSGNTSFTFNSAGISYTSKTAFTILFARSGDDSDSVFTGTWGSNKAGHISWYSNDHATTSYRPYLVITYTIPDTTPPASITGLTNDTPTCNSINWSWANPGDADFNGTMIYNNGAFVHNGTAGSTSSAWSSLSEGTSYTFSSRTFDTTGNVNSTWVNATATTGVCSDTTPPASITSLYTTTPMTCLGPINWNWTNPLDADFNHTEVYQNGAFYHNVTTNYDSWSGLIGSTAYTISTHTCDTTGNCNATWVNETQNTPECILPTTNFTYNTTCGIENLTVMFNDTSTDATSYYWDLGDGNTSFDQNITHLYDYQGVFTVSHNATNDYGTTWKNVSGFMVIPPGAYCSDPSGRCTNTTSTGECEDDDGIYWILFGVIGGLFGTTLFTQRKDGMT